MSQQEDNCLNVDPTGSPEEQDQVASPRKGLGGPRTPEGKTASRRNAMKHGLRAEKLAMEARQQPEFNRHLQQLREEYKPQGATEDLLVHEMWRHSCFLQLIANMEAASLRGEFDWDKKSEYFGMSVDEDNHMVPISRYRRTHERGFYDALRRLLAFRALRAASASAAARHGSLAGKNLKITERTHDQ